MDKLLSIVIVNYRTSVLLSSLLSGLRGEIKGLSSEILVIDNSCSLQEKALLKRLRASYPEVRFVLSRYNRGFAGACNLGTRLSKGRYLLFMNADVVPLKGSVESLLKCAMQVGAHAVAPLLYLNARASVLHPPFLPVGFLHRALKLISNRAYLAWWKRYSLRLWHSKKPVRVRYLTGAVFMLEKKLANMDESYPLYFEDADLFERLKALGAKVFLCPESRMIHYYDLSPSAAKGFLWKISEDVFLRKHFSGWQRGILKFLERLRSTWEIEGKIPLGAMGVKNTPVYVSPNRDFIPFAYGVVDADFVRRFSTAYATFEL